MILGRFQIARRNLGTVTRGPKLRDVPKHAQLAMDFFMKPALSYSDYHQRLTSLRIFVFWGTVSALTVNLIANPPRSSYFNSWTPWGFVKTLFGKLTKPADNVFNHGGYTDRVDVPSVYAQLVSTRRMDNEEVTEVYKRREIERQGREAGQHHE
jgi:hypothetical protein